MGKIPVTARPETLPRTSNWGSGRRILSDSPPRIRPTTGPLVVLVASAGEFDPPRLGRGKTTCGFGRHLEKRALISTVVPSPMHRFSRPIDQLESLLRIVIPNEVRDLQSRQLQVPRFFHHIRTVPTITDTIPALCEDHFQIAGAKRVPAFRGGALTLLKNTLPSDVLKTKKQKIGCAHSQR